MSSLPYSTPEGTTTDLSNGHHYSQAVRLPDNIIKISGQGGWHSSEGKVIAPTSAENIIEQVERTFANVDNVLRNAGSKNGWGDVYLVRAYLVEQDSFDKAVIQGWIQSVKKWCPNHRPLLTGIEVNSLYFPEMRVELEVKAYVGQ